MRKVFLSLLFVLSGLAVNAANPGTTCATAKPLGENFSETITGPFPKVVWYKAMTFDLPLTVYFAPQNETDPAPEVEMDFSCTSGYYQDSILCSLFCRTGGSSGIDMNMPHKPALQTDRLPDGTFVYYLSLGKKYRDLLLQMGISYNLEVVVKVTYHSAGEISIAPNDLFANCMDGHKFIHLGDTVQVGTQDKNRHVIVPYVQWQEDSIRYVWEGTEDVIAAVGYGCSYDPTDNGDATILDVPVLHAPKDTLKLTSSELRYYVQEAESEAGMFYAKFYTNGTGTMKIEQVPQAPPQGGATLLKYDRVTPVDTAKLYAIPFTWTTATRFDVPTAYIFRMYVGLTHDFTKETAIASYRFNRNSSGHWYGLQASEMQALWARTSAQYLYVRFECGEKTTITPSLWRPSDCVSSTTLITKNSTFTINARSNTIYRIYYNDWKDGDMSVYFNQNDLCKMLVKGTCEIGTNGSAAYYYEELEDKVTTTIPASEIATWADAVDEDGYIYMRFYTTRSGGGKITLSTTAPEEVDPAPVLYPAATVSVVCDGDPTSAGQPYIVRVSVAQTLNLYPGPADDIASRTPLQSWSQAPGETHQLTLQPDVYTLMGAETKIQIEVQ